MAARRLLNGTDVVLRGYRPEDLEAMFQLDELCFEPPFRFSRAEMRRYAQAHNAHVVIIEIAGHLAGFCIAHVNQSSDDTTGYIVTLDVAPEHRRKGIASLLMREAERQVAEAGCGAMVLHVFSGNAGAISFYEREGYALFRAVPNFYAKNVNALVYCKPLG
jgi:[ribosomal protein S18]-alanine N-acetyltransferase